MIYTTIFNQPEIILEDENIEKIIEFVSNNVIGRINSLLLYEYHIIQNIDQYLNKLKYNGSILHSANIKNELIKFDYGFEIKISIEYIIPYKNNYKPIKYNKIIKSDLNDMIDKSKSNLQKQLDELFKTI